MNQAPRTQLRIAILVPVPPADATWRGQHADTARLVTGDVVAAVRALKDEPGDELQVWGSGNLLQTLLQYDLIDRLRLMTFPLVLGSGRRLFKFARAGIRTREPDVSADRERRLLTARRHGRSISAL